MQSFIEVNRMNFLLTNPPRPYCFDWYVHFGINFTKIRVEYAHLILTEIYPKFTPTRSINSEWFWMCVFITREQLKNPLAQQVVEKVRPKPKGTVVLSFFPNIFCFETRFRAETRTTIWFFYDFHEQKKRFFTSTCSGLGNPKRNLWFPGCWKNLYLKVTFSNETLLCVFLTSYKTLLNF